MNSLVILFAKAPRPGRVKTRLCPPLTAQQACRLHVAFVADTLSMVTVLADVDVELHTDVHCACWPEYPVPRRVQLQADLGGRMLHAIDSGLERGYRRVMIVGSDSPSLPAGHLCELLKADADVALGPADDGGYYAVCCRKTDARMFDGVAFSTDQALRGTIQASARAGLAVAIGEPWYDIDTFEDLQRLRSDPAALSRTRAALRGPGYFTSGLFGPERSEV